MPEKKKKEKIEYVKKVAKECSIDFEKAWSEFEFYEIYIEHCPDDFKNFREYLEDLLNSEFSIDKIIDSISKDSVNISFEGGLGKSFEDAVIIRGIKNPNTGPFAETKFLSAKYGTEGIDWTYEKQELFIEKDKAYDVITIRFPDDSSIKVYFDINEFYGKYSFASQTDQPDPLIERADNLVGAAQINAEGMFAPLLDHFPILQQVDVEHLNFILTVASVFIATNRLNNLRLGNDREERLMKMVAERLDQWKPNGIRGFEDCKELFESKFDQLTKAGHEPRFVASDAVGIWVVSNVLGQLSQTDEECKLLRTIGGMLTQVFFDWWGEW